MPMLRSDVIAQDREHKYAKKTRTKDHKWKRKCEKPMIGVGRVVGDDGDSNEVEETTK